MHYKFFKIISASTTLGQRIAAGFHVPFTRNDTQVVPSVARSPITDARLPFSISRFSFPIPLYPYLLLATYFLLYLSSCGAFKSTPKIEIQPTDRLAVLPFVVRGDGLSEAMGHIAADRLTAGLLNQKRLPIVDRSFVNDALTRLNIGNSYFLSPENAMLLSDTLGAKLLALGVLDNRSNFQESGRLKHQLRITVRLLDPASGELLLLKEQELTKQNDIQGIIQEGLDSIISDLAITFAKPSPQDSLSNPKEVTDEQPPTAAK